MGLVHSFSGQSFLIVPSSRDLRAGSLARLNRLQETFAGPSAGDLTSEALRLALKIISTYSYRSDSQSRS